MTNEPKHTPGPWIYKDKEPYPCFVTVEIPPANEKEKGSAVRFVTYASDLSWRDADRRKANARLIAAAPELLEALEVVLQAHEHGCDLSDSRLLEIERILATAKGETKEEETTDD